jgi:glycosyltransferase involved in cell wall biosynthesis
MRILAFPKYGDLAASTRQRLLQYVPYLREHGVDVDCLPLHGNDYMRALARGQSGSKTAIAKAYAERMVQLLRRRDFDLLWVYAELFPYLPGAFERLVRASGKPIIFDYDDAIFHMYDAHRRPLVRRLLGRKLVPLLRAASACTCGNAYLHAYASQYCSRSIILPTVVDTDAYRPSSVAGAGNPPLTVGWIGSPSTWTYVEPLLPMLRELLPRFGARLLVVGAGPKAGDLSWIDAREWSQEREITDIQHMDIGIMPVPDEPWARGKCGYKLIQYMACGLPTVASPVGVNGEIVLDGTTGLVASDLSEWKKGLERLLKDAALRRSMGAAGRRRVENEYSLKVHAPRLLDLLRSLERRDV